VARAKIFTSVEALKEFIAEKSKEYTHPFTMSVGLSTGCFDLTHAGHDDLLRQAKVRCDLLVAAVTPDEAVRSRKGDERPYFPQADRAQIIASCRHVDAVLMLDSNEPDPAKLWPPVYHELKPNILFFGHDQKGHGYDIPEGTVVCPINSTIPISTSLIAKRHHERAQEEAKGR